MTHQIDFAGKSGMVYRYTTVEENRALPPAGGNYLIAKITPDGAIIVFAGQTDNLSAGSWRDLYNQARETYGATDVLMRLNVRGVVRQAEQDDLIEEHHPPMNGEQRV